MIRREREYYPEELGAESRIDQGVISLVGGIVTTAAGFLIASEPLSLHKHLPNSFEEWLQLGLFTAAVGIPGMWMAFGLRGVVKGHAQLQAATTARLLKESFQGTSGENA